MAGEKFDGSVKKKKKEKTALEAAKERVVLTDQWDNEAFLTADSDFKSELLFWSGFLRRRWVVGTVVFWYETVLKKIADTIVRDKMKRIEKFEELKGRLNRWVHDDVEKWWKCNRLMNVGFAGILGVTYLTWVGTLR